MPKEWDYYESNFSKEDLYEIDDVYDYLESDEDIEITARQSKVMPGGKIIAPESIFATNKRIMIKESNTVGLRDEIYSIKYSEIRDILIERGMFTSKLIIEGKESSRYEELFIDAIPKDKAAEIYKLIIEKTNESHV